MMIIGLEGVSCVGKTTLAAALAARLVAAGVAAVVVRCYYHAAPDPSRLPPPDSATADEQLAALRALLQVEALRRTAALNAAGQGQLVILDRTVDTLLAHAHAMGRLHGYDCDVRAKVLVRDHPIVVPDLTLLLSASDEVRVRRAAHRAGMPRLFYDPTFTRYFTDHFEQPLVARLVRIRTDGRAEHVTEQAAEVIGEHHSSRTGAAA